VLVSMRGSGEGLSQAVSSPLLPCAEGVAQTPVLSGGFKTIL
jgi:hypothetical protein